MYIDNSGVTVYPIGTRVEAREKAQMQGVSHFLGWQENTVAYGNKHNIDDFRELGSGYRQENSHTETFPSGFLIATMTEQ